MASYLYSPSSSRSSSESSNLDNTPCCRCTVQYIMIYTPEWIKTFAVIAKFYLCKLSQGIYIKAWKTWDFTSLLKRRKRGLEKKKSQGFPPQMGTLESHKNLWNNSIWYMKPPGSDLHYAILFKSWFIKDPQQCSALRTISTSFSILLI